MMQTRLKRWLSGNRFAIVAALVGLSSAAVGFVVTRPTEPESVLSQQLADGRQVSSLLAKDTPNAVFVYEPNDYFACRSAFATWRKLQRDGTVNLVLLLRRDPTPEERRLLAIQRIRPSGELRRPVFPWQGASVELLVDRTGVHAVADGRPQLGDRSPVLQYVLSHQHAFAMWQTPVSR